MYSHTQIHTIHINMLTHTHTLKYTPYTHAHTHTHTHTHFLPLSLTLFHTHTHTHSPLSLKCFPSLNNGVVWRAEPAQNSMNRFGCPKPARFQKAPMLAEPRRF